MLVALFEDVLGLAFVKLLLMLLFCRPRRCFGNWRSGVGRMWKGKVKSAVECTYSFGTDASHGTKVMSNSHFILFFFLLVG